VCRLSLDTSDCAAVVKTRLQGAEVALQAGSRDVSVEVIAAAIDQAEHLVDSAVSSLKRSCGAVFTRLYSCVSGCCGIPLQS
jgi:hypothetical protein